MAPNSVSLSDYREHAGKLRAIKTLLSQAKKEFNKKQEGEAFTLAQDAQEQLTALPKRNALFKQYELLSQEISKLKGQVSEALEKQATDILDKEQDVVQSLKENYLAKAQPHPHLLEPLVDGLVAAAESQASTINLFRRRKIWQEVYEACEGKPELVEGARVAEEHLQKVERWRKGLLGIMGSVALFLIAFMSWSFIISPPPPIVIDSLEPNSISAGDAATELILRGENFEEGMTVLWDDEKRQIDFESQEKVSVNINQADLKWPGKVRILLLDSALTPVSNEQWFTVVEPTPTVIPSPTPIINQLHCDLDIRQIAGDQLQRQLWPSDRIAQFSFDPTLSEPQNVQWPNVTLFPGSCKVEEATTLNYILRPTETERFNSLFKSENEWQVASLTQDGHHMVLQSQFIPLQSAPNQGQLTFQLFYLIQGTPVPIEGTTVVLQWQIVP